MGKFKLPLTPPKPFAEVGKQVLLTPEQVHAAGNIQPKPGPASPIKGGQRRVEGAPIGERLEGLGIGGRIGITNRKVGHQARASANGNPGTMPAASAAWSAQAMRMPPRMAATVANGLGPVDS